MNIRVLLSMLLFMIMSAIVSTIRAAAVDTPDTPAYHQKETQGYSNTLFIGYDLYTLRPKSATTYSLSGFVIGYSIDFNILKDYPLMLGTGIDGRFTFRDKTFHDSATYDQITAKVSTRFINFNIPLNISYKVPLSPVFSITPQFGFDFRIQAFGRAKTEVTVPESNHDSLVKTSGFIPGNVNLFSKNALGNEALKRFQFGWHAALKLQYDQYVIGVSYGTDFAKLRNELGSSNLLVNFGYVF